MEILSRSIELQKVKVTILLSGGHQHTFYAQSNTPILQNLFQAIVAKSKKQETNSDRLFQVLSDGEHSALCFPEEHGSIPFLQKH
jgi:SM-20-related protein